MEEAQGISRSRVAVVATAAVCVVVASGVIVYIRNRRCEKQEQLLRLVQEDKPQKKFKRVLADNSDAPFQHLASPATGLQQGHPYAEVICSFVESPQFAFPKYYGAHKVPPGMGGPFIWVQSRVELEALVVLLNNETEIGVDMEHHSVRSFRGFTALVQISTHSIDFLVDAIQLHDDMHLLHSVFANPLICKVLHGADNDILWLQRDFHIYIVNLFDTARACDALGKPQRSLAYLLQTYCGVSTDKKYQKADWRVRPLPSDMKQYARTDAHYLLYIAHCLRTELLKFSMQDNGDDCNNTGLLADVVRRSNMLSLQLYEQEGIGASLLTVTNSLLARLYSNSASHTLAEDDFHLRKLVMRLCEWRDAVARAEDESVRFVLSDAALLALATMRPLTYKSILSTITAADLGSQASEGSLPPGVPPLPSPSPVVQHEIASLQGVLLDFARQILWPWKCFSELNDYGGFLSGSIVSFLHKTSFLSTLGLQRNSAPGEGKESRLNIRRRREGGDQKNIPKRWKLGNVEQARLNFVKKFSCKAPVYHNCRIYAGDGRLLCFCDRKKLDWYVKRGLAEDLKEDPPAIRLLFEPKGRPEDENNEFYIQSKTNRCVGCGESSHYLRYRIIPSCYRQHFPEHLKSHRSHDIVLLCVDCHEIAHRAAEKHKREIAFEFGVPLFAQRVVDSGNEDAGTSEVAFLAEGDTGGVSPLQLRSAAMALSRHGPTMPVERRKELEEVVRHYYGGRDIGPEDLTAALLVGVGPREHRRLMRKKSHWQNLRSSEAKEKQCNTTDAETPELGTSLHTSVGSNAENVNNISANPGEDEMLLGEGEEKSGDSDEGNHQHVNTVDTDGRDSTKDVSATSISNEGSGLPSNNTHKSMHRESLLGHGPHGRQVVDMLIAKSGDDGIRHFCQIWRAVFVDALQPAYLPPGWDVSHSVKVVASTFSPDHEQPTLRVVERLEQWGRGWGGGGCNWDEHILSFSHDHNHNHNRP